MSFLSVSSNGNWLTNNQLTPECFNPLLYQNSIDMMKKSDKEFVTKWALNKLARVNYSKTVENLSVPDMKQSLNKVFYISQKIRDIQKLLKKNVTSMTAEEWENHIALAKHWKDEISKEVLWKDEKLCELLKKKLSKRLNKRARLKKKKLEMQILKKQKQLLSNMKNKEIDDWLCKMREELENKKKEEKFQVLADDILKDVTKRKATARRNLALLEALKSLREAREKSALGRGEKVSSKESLDFSTNIEKLKALWNYALDQYCAEEKDLRSSLQEDTDENIKHEDSFKVNNLKVENSSWSTILFGSDQSMPQRNFKRDMRAFINVRKQWDQYLSYESENASSLPVGWVLPSVEPCNGWGKYLMQ